MRKKIMMIATVIILAALIASVFVITQAGAFINPKPEYVIYELNVTLSPTGAVYTHVDSSGFPVVVSDGYVPDTAIVAASATINGVVYSYPKDFDYNYTFHVVLNEVTGYGIEMVQETLAFKNLPGHPTLIGRTEEKVSGEILSPTVDVSHLEVAGNFQLTGTGMFRNVQGSGYATIGVSTGFVVYHFAWISGWPL